MGRRTVSVKLAWLSLVACLVLAIASGAAAGPTRTVVLKRLVPPATGRAYFGLTFRLWDTTDPLWGDTRPFSVRIGDAIQHELGGKRPTFLTVYAPWRNADGTPATFHSLLGDVRKAQAFEGGGKLLYLDWTFVATGDPAAYTGITTRDVASGKLDGYITEYAREIKAYGRPVLIRLFGGEFNGSWWVSVSPLANPKLTTGDFVRAWRRVVDIFRRVGARNVSWAWVANAFPPTGAPWVDSNLSAYYPGAAYVDWAGADMYDLGPPTWLDGAYAFASTHHKPFFLAEWGVRHGDSVLAPTQDRQWLSDMFDYIESHGLIKAIAYFDYKAQPSPSLVGHVFLDDGQVNYAPNVDDFDHRLLADSGANFSGTFSLRIGESRYVSAIRTKTVRLKR